MKRSPPAEADSSKKNEANRRRRARTASLPVSGPGLITGAADDDPGGIATYSQAGAEFRYSLVWTLFLTWPLMVGIQMLSARVGWATGNGLAKNIDRMCPRWLTVSLVGLLVVANTINIAADLAAMGEAVRLLAGGWQPLYVLGFGALCIGTQIWFSYEQTVRVLKWLTLGLFAYVGGDAHRRRALEDGGARVAAPWSFLPAGTTLAELRRDGGGGARHDDQPVSVLLAGVAGSRGHAAAVPAGASCCATRSTSPSICRGSSRTRSSA